jgi:hypothetical protein
MMVSKISRLKSNLIVAKASLVSFYMYNLYHDAVLDAVCLIAL